MFSLSSTNKVFLAALGVIIASSAVLAIGWENISDPVAVHFGDGGRPDSWAPKTFRSVFFFIFFALTIEVVLYIVSWLLIRLMPSSLPDKKQAMLFGACSALGWLALLLVIANSLLAFSSAFASWHSFGPVAVTIVSVLAMLSPILVLVFSVVSMDNPPRHQS